MPNTGKRGQATLLLLVAMSLFLLGALGLAIDASHLYAQRQMAQAAADAAATAAIHAMYSRTNTAAMNNAFGGTPFDCAAGSNLTPCYQARANGFDASNGDTISVSFPGSVPGVTLTGSFDPAAVTVTVFRNVDTTLMRFLGPTTARVAASATAAMLEEVSPIPILVLHPDKSAAFEKVGTSDIIICGGPTRSIQVNSYSATSVVNSGTSGTVNLSQAGPGGTGGWITACDGNGADFANFGAPATYPGTFLPGVDGRYLPYTGPIHDPLKDVPPPPIGSAALSPTWNGGLRVPQGVYGCPATWPRPCQLFLPGRYPNGIRGQGGSGARTNSSACAGSGADCISLFAPGIYYMQSNGFHGGSNSDLRMAACNAPPYSAPGPPPINLPGTPSDPETGCGMLIYNTGNGSDDIFEVGANGNANLLGSLNDGLYKGGRRRVEAPPAGGRRVDDPGRDPVHHQLGDVRRAGLELPVHAAGNPDLSGGGYPRERGEHHGNHRDDHRRRITTGRRRTDPHDARSHGPAERHSCGAGEITYA
jgi:Flp pilus assembly protein TadG